MARRREAGASGAAARRPGQLHRHGEQQGQALHGREHLLDRDAAVGDDRDDGVGSYAFKLWDVPQPDSFAIDVGQVISNGVPGPGAGHIEIPGVRDVYTFEGSAAEEIFVDVLDVEQALFQINWRLNAPDGSELFNTIFNCCGGMDPGAFTLPQTGVYTITVGEDEDDAVGTYSFQIRRP